MNVTPGNQYRDGCQESRKNNQPQAQAVDSDVPVNIRIRNPDDIVNELLAGLAGLKAGDQAQREHEREQRNNQREGSREMFLFTRNEQRDQEPCGRQRDQSFQKVHRVTPMTTITTTAPITTHVA